MEKNDLNSRIEHLVKLKQVCIYLIQGIDLGHEEKSLKILNSLKSCTLKIKLDNILYNQIILNHCFRLQKEKFDDLVGKQHEVYRSAEDIYDLIVKEIRLFQTL